MDNGISIIPVIKVNKSVMYYPDDFVSITCKGTENKVFSGRIEKIYCTNANEDIVLDMSSEFRTKTIVIPLESILSIKPYLKG